MEDLENSEIMEAYNRLSLLLDQQKPSSPEIESNIPFKSENNKKKSTTLENKIDILTNLIAVDHTKESQNLQTSYPLLNESAHSIGTHHSFGVDKMEFNGNNEKNITSKNILPHMDDLITVLVDNNIASHDINDLDQNKIYNSPSKPQAEKNGGKKLKMHTIKARKYDAFAIFKKANPGEFKKTLERFLLLEKLKNEKIENIKKELEENEQKQIKPHPEINHESHILAGQRSKPLHLRTNDILSAKKERQKLLKDQLHMEKELKDPTSNHKPNLEWTQNRSFSSAKKHRNPTEFLKDIESWYQKRNEKIQASQIKILKDDFEKMPFHPKINKKWKNLTNLEDFQNVEERLLEVGKQYKEKEKEKLLSLTPTFTPKINKKSYKLAEKKEESKSPNINEFLSVSADRKPRPSFLENTISYSSKGKEKFVKNSDEKDLKQKSKGNDESFFEKNKKKHKINVVEYNDSNKFVVEALKSKKQPKIMLKIN